MNIDRFDEDTDRSVRGVGVAEAVKTVLSQEAAEDEALALERELALSDSDDDIAGLEDTLVQRVQPLLELWRETDGKRASLRRRVEIDRKVNDKDAAKQGLAEIQGKIMPRLSAILKQMVEELAKDDMKPIRDNIQNWMGMPTNLRPHLKKHLKAQGIDISAVLRRAEELETEERRLAEATA